MPRIRLKPLDHYPFKVPITVRITDLNYRGHLGNDRLLGLVHEARVAFLASLGMTEMDSGGVSLILADAAVDYRNQAFAGEELTFEVAAGELSRNGFRLLYKFLRRSDSKLIALAETGMVCFDYRQMRTVRLPAETRQGLLRGTSRPSSE
jgi:acyl-CoA thioesterase FadM